MYVKIKYSSKIIQQQGDSIDQKVCEAVKFIN